MTYFEERWDKETEEKSLQTDLVADTNPTLLPRLSYTNLRRKSSVVNNNHSTVNLNEIRVNSSLNLKSRIST